MRTSFGIFLRDLKALGRNPAALLVVIALLVLPGLYAWYCIVANWDPYSNTGNVPIAVVNEDEGATSDLTGEINLGKQVADELHDNHNIDWRFYDSEEEALEATRRFECYAALVMPKDLSKNVVGIFDGSDEQPVIYFYPNEKQNAVAVKVSDSAAQTLVTQINQQFASTVNETVLKKVQEGADKVDEQTSRTRSTLASEVDDTQAQIANVTQSLDSTIVTISAINGWRESVAGSQASLSAAAQQLPALRTSLADSSATLNNLRVETIAFDSVFSKSLSQTNLALANLSLRISADMSATESDVARVSADLDKSIELMSAELAAHGPNEVTEQLQIALQKLQSASDHLQSAVALADASTQNMNANVQTIVDKTNAANDTFSREVLPALSNGTYDLGISLSGLSSAVGQFEPQIVELQEVLAQTDAALVDAIAAIERGDLPCLELRNSRGAVLHVPRIVDRMLHLDISHQAGGRPNRIRKRHTHAALFRPLAPAHIACPRAIASHLRRRHCTRHRLRPPRRVHGVGRGVLVCVHEPALCARPHVPQYRQNAVHSAAHHASSRFFGHVSHRNDACVLQGGSSLPAVHVRNQRNARSSLRHAGNRLRHRPDRRSAHHPPRVPHRPGDTSLHDERAVDVRRRA